MPRHLFARHPPQRPRRRPRPGVGAGIVHRQIVFERIQIRTRYFLYQLQLVRVRQAAVGEPEILVETTGVDSEGVALPLTNRSAVEQRVLVVATHLPLVAAAVGIDDAVVVVAAADQHEDPLPYAVL